jgi:hypothetical protein
MTNWVPHGFDEIVNDDFAWLTPDVTAAALMIVPPWLPK